MTTTDQIWRILGRQSFAVLSHITPDGEPRSSGVVYTLAGRSLLITIATDSWKARQIPTDGRVAVTVPVRRGGPLVLMFPIPPATISFHGTAEVLAPRLARRAAGDGGVGADDPARPAGRQPDHQDPPYRPVRHLRHRGVAGPDAPARTRAGPGARRLTPLIHQTLTKPPRGGPFRALLMDHAGSWRRRRADTARGPLVGPVRTRAGAARRTIRALPEGPRGPDPRHRRMCRRGLANGAGSRAQRTRPG